jgi:NitT/TauT family transport system permease protein
MTRPSWARDSNGSSAGSMLTGSAWNPRARSDREAPVNGERQHMARLGKLLERHGSPTDRVTVSGDSEIIAPPKRGSARLAVRGLWYLQYLVLPALVILAWQYIPEILHTKPSIFPNFSTVMRAWGTWIFGATDPTNPFSGTWLSSLVTSALRVLEGFAIGTACALVVGLALGYWRVASRVADPTLQLLRPIPLTAWVPLAILWFGIDRTTALFLIGLGTFFPVYLGTSNAVRLVDKVLIRAGQMLGCGRLTLLFRVVLPAAFPTILTSIRLGLGFAWLMVVLAEELAVTSGLGYSLWDAYNFTNTTIVIAAMLSIGLAGFASDLIFRGITAPLVRWTKGRTR